MPKSIQIVANFVVPDSHIFVDDNHGEPETVTYTTEDAEKLACRLVEYLTSPEGLLNTDYGPHAWGGYNEAVIVEATATAHVEGRRVATAQEVWMNAAG